jgi:hypothetical protein
MNEAETRQVLQVAIDAKRERAFRDPAATPDERALGCLIAEFFRWDGGEIIDTFLAALEDANFHSDAETIRTALAASVPVL